MFDLLDLVWFGLSKAVFIFEVGFIFEVVFVFDVNVVFLFDVIFKGRVRVIQLRANSCNI